MANNLATRIALLERMTAKPLKTFRIICKGVVPTPDEQSQIDDAENKGLFVICRTIVECPLREC